MTSLVHASPIRSTHDTPMQVGDSFGDACRHCGSTLIIIAPPSSAGRCAVCSPEAKSWGERDAARRDREVAAPREPWPQLRLSPRRGLRWLSQRRAA